MKSARFERKQTF